MRRTYLLFKYVGICAMEDRVFGFGEKQEFG